MCDRLKSKLLIQKHMGYPDFSLSRDEALKLSDYGSVEVKDLIEGGIEGGCYNNSLQHCFENHRAHEMEYCLGFARGRELDYKPHAWIKRNGQYIEVSPQRGGNKKLVDYVLCHTISIPEFISILKDNGIKSAVAPMIDRRGFIVLSDVPDTNLSLPSSRIKSIVISLSQYLLVVIRKIKKIKFSR